MASTVSFFFFFNDTATTEIYTLSLHDALPISFYYHGELVFWDVFDITKTIIVSLDHERYKKLIVERSEEHTSELQSQSNLVCRLLLEKKKKQSVTSYRIFNTESLCRVKATIRP